VHTLRITFGKLFTLLLVLSIAFSLAVFADHESEDDKFEEFDFDGDLEDERFEDDFRDNDKEFRSEFRDDGDRIESRDGEFRTEERFREDDKRYEFEDRRRYDDEPDFGPEYENREEMLFGRLFGLIEDDINEFELLQNCGNPDKIADIVIGKVRGRIGDISNACSDIGKDEIECQERIKRDCGQIGKSDLRYARDERERKEMEAYACPPNKDLIVELCVDNSREWIDDRLQYLEEDCEFEWQQHGGARDSECSRLETEQFCDEDKFVEQCIQRHEPFEVQCPDIRHPECHNGYIEEEFDDNGCLVDSFCVEFKNQCGDHYDPVCGDDGVTYHNDCKAEKAGIDFSYGECGRCSITEEDALRMENDCYANNGNPKRFYDGECVSEVSCHIEEQCPVNDEEIRKKYDDCVANNGDPEDIWEGDCVVEVLCHTVTASDDTTRDDGSLITGNVVGISGAFTYEEAKRQCQDEWGYEKDHCRDLDERCDKNAFVDSCIAREKQNVEFDLENNKRQCERDSRIQISHMDRECSRMDAERQQCFDRGNEQCNRMAGLADECHETMTEDNFRAFIIKESDKHCKFVPFLKKDDDFAKYDRMEVTLAVLDTVTEEDISKLGSIVEDLERKFELDGKIIFGGIMNPNNFVDIKRLNFVVDAKLNSPAAADRAGDRKTEIISRLDPLRVVEKLLEIRDTDISSEYKYLVEDRASDLLEASDEIDEVEESEGSRGFAYKIKLFLGFAKDAEESEIESLEMSKERLETSITTLSGLIDTIPDDIAKAILTAQVEDLERQKADMDDLIESKRKKAAGLLRLFGLFG
jgi:hypothetical protein